MWYNLFIGQEETKQDTCRKIQDRIILCVQSKCDVMAHVDCYTISKRRYKLVTSTTSSFIVYRMNTTMPVGIARWW